MENVMKQVSGWKRIAPRSPSRRQPVPPAALTAATTTAEQLRVIYATMAAGVVVLDRTGAISDANPAAERILGLSLAAMRGRVPSHDLWAVIDADGTPLPDDERPLLTALRTGQPHYDRIVGVVRQDGERRWLREDVVPMLDEDGTVRHVVASFTDVTARVRAEDAFATERDLLHVLVDAMPDMIYLKDTQSRFTRINAAQMANLGLQTVDEALGKTDLDFFPPELARGMYADDQRILATGEPLINDIEKHVDAMQRTRWLLTTKMPIERDGQIRGIVGISRDITDLKATEEVIAHQALHDTLTGLPNRKLLDTRLQDILEAETDDGIACALLLMDLNGFKEINDTFGHQCGDHVLQQVAARLTSVLREGDTVARLGGDEFAVLMPGADRQIGIGAAERIGAELEKPFLVDGYPLEVGISIGIVLCPDHGEESATLLRRADVAMYVAKRRGDSYAVYTTSQDANSPDRLTLMAALRHAITHGQLVLHYQPQAALRHGQVERVEALVRWNHPIHGLLAPDTFIPLAEHSGLIAPLTWWVLDAAVRQCAQWQRLEQPIGVAVNLSVRMLHEPQLVETVAETLARHRVSPKGLTLEITESSLMDDPSKALDALRRLAALGVRLAIDDFGAGYSSLGYLRRLPVDEVKIDKSFVIGVGHNNRTAELKDTAIVRAVIALAHALGLEVVAEGVETEAAWAVLAALGCDMAQGYFLSRAVPAPELERCIAEAAWTRRSVEAVSVLPPAIRFPATSTRILDGSKLQRQAQ